MEKNPLASNDLGSKAGVIGTRLYPPRTTRARLHLVKIVKEARRFRESIVETEAGAQLFDSRAEQQG